ncbi:phospholipase D family protein [Marilutibacter chinensis]|uniref:Phospholipase D family protein n=1 Tax=Marilutibacter chinensis TaxID=2912247 RepID=A0ABS9HXP1_9GAMM|nr:phospholipase D family protein [Lysobacter chinensis]MCF7222902.1 phospholipase D family protein [Lysobacter chinensis]
MTAGWSRRIRLLAVAWLALSLGACASLSGAQRDRAQAIAMDARSSEIACAEEDACAEPSPLRELAADAFAASTPEAPRHYALILDRGPEALMARLNLIRSATTAIDLQTFIFDEDDASRLVLDELLAAARRGVRVRVLMDQLSALRRVETLAALAGAHSNFEVRLYNPVLKQALISYPEYALAALCCWNQLNQRMHTKLLLVDGAVGISGGRNYQDDYYDWDASYNFRDRDVLVAGPVAHAMAADFELFWNDKRSVPAARLDDVGGYLLKAGVPPLELADYQHPARAQAMRDEASDPERIEEALVAHAIPVGEVRYISDTPDKHAGLVSDEGASRTLRELIESARDEVLMQTPYLVLSRPAQEMFRQMQERAEPPRVVVSTNSLAATDAFIVYALSHKYKRRYLREFGFHIYEYKPFPTDAPIDLDATGAEPDGAAVDAVASTAVTFPNGLSRSDLHRELRTRYDRRSAVGRAQYRRALTREHAALRFSSRAAHEPVPLKRAGVRIGMHAKSLVIDGRVGVIGTHNFDPRGDHYNTEAAVVIEDEAFATALADSIRRDIRPENSWVVARRDKPPVFSGLDYSVGKAFEYLPLFDIWPLRYATSYEFVPGPDCPEPLPPDDPGFRACYRPVGDFPEVDFGLKGFTTRIFTAFGAGLAPIL